MDWEAWLAFKEQCGDDEPPDLGEYRDPEDPALPGEDEELAEIQAEARQAAADQAAAEAHIARLGQTATMAAIASTAMGRRGPGMPGSAHLLPGECSGSAGGFATGQALDVAPGGPVLLGLADRAAGDDDRFAGVSDDELLGVVCGADRCEAAASALKHAAVAALIRRRPAPGCILQGPADMPKGWDEFTSGELAPALGESRIAMDGLLELAYDLAVKLPGTRALFRDGIISRYKAQIIADATQILDPAEARAAEAMVLDRAGRLTPGGLRAAIARAVMDVAPDKARERREKAERKARVERWDEFSGNAALVGRELPPVEVLAADQRINSWARQLKAAGLDGSMDQLRARAYLDLLLGTDSRPDQPAADGSGPHSAGPDGSEPEGGPDAPRGGGSGPDGPGTPAPGGPLADAVPAGFAGRVNLTIPLATLLDMADRPGEIPGIGPIDPWLARDLARAAARNPRTSWCVTVTDEQGHAIGHGCARPEPKSPGKHREKRRKPGPPDGRDPPSGAGSTGAPGFAFTASDRHGPPGGYGTWRLSTGRSGPPGLLIALDPIATDQCDHRFAAKGHDPGVKLWHLSQIRYATCTGPVCRRPAATCDFEHNIPYEAGGRSCLCNGGPKCRHDHRLKQDPRWNVDQFPDGTFRWTTPSGRQYTTEPTRYPI